MAQDEIGRRVAESIPAGVTQGQVANQIGLSDEKLSKSLRGKRAFSSVELALLAEVLNTDVHWLITGKQDPRRIVVVARHAFDHETGTRAVPGRCRDRSALDGVELAYRQAAFADRESCSLPIDVEQIRDALGPDFVRPFAARIESNLGVDVVRLPELSTAYSFRVGARMVIVVPATGNWFRENWDLAHELGHLVLHHHADNLSERERDRCESTANSFAAELLLPETLMRSVDWGALSAGELADQVWNLGVSTTALATRLSSLDLPVGYNVSELLAMKTQRLLRWHWAAQRDGGSDAITRRMDDATTRRFPLSLQEAHTDRIAEGAIGKGTLAWMLGIDPDALEVDEPPSPEPISTDQLAAELGL